MHTSMKYLIHMPHLSIWTHSMYDFICPRIYLPGIGTMGGILSRWGYYIGQRSENHFYNSSGEEENEEGGSQEETVFGADGTNDQTSRIVYNWNFTNTVCESFQEETKVNDKKGGNIPDSWEFSNLGQNHVFCEWEANCEDEISKVNMI